MFHNNQKKIAVINDFCGFGRCSIAVSLPIISAMKIQCCPLPTAIFSNHTGYKSFYCTDYTDHMSAYMEEWSKLDLHFDGILSGYLASPNQIEIVRRFIETFKEKDTVTVIDPVMGDNGKLYPSYSSILANKMKTLVECADILTPNLTEACILTDTSYCEEINEEALLSICNKLSDIGPARIVISGLECDGDMLNYVYERGETPHIIREHKVGTSRAGTGDVFSSIIAADVVNGKSFIDAVSHASAFVSRALKHTVDFNIPETDGICFEEFLKEI